MQKNNNITTLNELEGAKLLKQWGIPVVDSVLAHDYTQALAAANSLGFPIALKVCSEAVLHKTEQGGVVLNIKNKKSLERAVREINKKFADTPHALLVQKMAKPGFELIIGGRRDPVFGPV
ncbi:MAG TPA: acetate--CoA ligase family protein, partial [Smithellaceae bacterium]|nr:acetate--CoA ligase family protein [Smithellaceae bacterium]